MQMVGRVVGWATFVIYRHGDFALLSSQEVS